MPNDVTGSYHVIPLQPSRAWQRVPRIVPRRAMIEARAAVALPCLRKDFLVDPWQVAESRALGADCILIILAMIEDALAADLLSEAARFGMDALIETHDEAEMARACALGGDLVGINNRSLRTFEVDLAATSLKKEWVITLIETLAKARSTISALNLAFNSALSEADQKDLLGVLQRSGMKIALNF